ncbi:MAG TPA: beta-ketoacyl synthase N-terminal-like domain-containing protein [Chthoniobacteraceae bacterium]|nr:beta-ketoacyl synthase N-terminal-like domain-containing protein [Chthoniobacteraceae bacterium]
MSLVVAGTGWVTPLGCGRDEVFDRLAAGESAAVEALPPSSDDRRAARHRQAPQWYVPVPDRLTAGTAKMPRIRRSSAITHLAMTAGLAALEEAGLPLSPGGFPPEIAARTAVVFAVCSGGVQYTRRLYEKIVHEGASGASPLLFPETVYNAPASHLAAALGLDGISYTLVGDGSVGLAALGFAEELLACHPELDQCVVVGSEESDWILWEGYATWRLCAKEPCVRLHRSPPAGMLLGEGAVALVVRRPEESPGPRIATAATSYARRRDAASALGDLLASSAAPCDWVVGSANGTWIDAVEAAALKRHLPGAPTFYPKQALGEALGAGSLQQVALGLVALEKGIIGTPETGLPHKIAVTSLGLNQQAGVAWIGRG